MKRSIKFISLILLILIIFPINANAKTLGQLKKEYSALEQKHNENQQKQKYTQSEINAAKNRVDSIYKEIDQANKDMQAMTNKISQLNNSIHQKEDQIKDLMRFIQVSEGESTYLEYIFKADSITDFIYRLSVTEQLSTYNNKLIDDMHNMIEENKNNIAALQKKEVDLKKLQSELASKIVILNQEKQALNDEDADIKQEIKDSLAIINFYIKAGCSENSDISTCAKKLLPAGTKFWRPTDSGFMQSKWNKDPMPGGGFRYHAGVDISNNSGTKIYSVSDGKVVITNHTYSPGVGYGKYIVINHNINGKTYTSLYGHLSSINVNVGQIVNKDTVIGYMGSTGRSQGPHLHLNICLGERTGCQSLSETVDPRNYINFPAHYTWYRDRNSYY